MLMACNKETDVPSPEFAVGLKAIDSFSGDIVTVRETGGDTTQSFTESQIVGSGAGSLDDFVGANDGRILRYLNQGTIALTNELEQTTNAKQPTIASSGVLKTDGNSNPYAHFLEGDGANMAITDSALMNSLIDAGKLSMSFFLLYEYTSNLFTPLINFRSGVVPNGDYELEITQTTPYWASGNDDKYRVHYRTISGGLDSSFYGAKDTTTINTQQLLSGFISDGLLELYLDGVLVDSKDYSPHTTFVLDEIDLMRSAGNAIFKELQIYSSNVKSHQSTIETAINTRWS